MTKRETETYEKKSFPEEEDFPLKLGEQVLPSFSVHHSTFPHDLHI
jgi:hypothetical protein